MIVVLVVFLAAEGKNRNVIKKYQNETVTRHRRESVTISNTIAMKN